MALRALEFEPTQTTCDVIDIRAYQETKKWCEWQSIWNSSINPEVIMGTIGAYNAYLEAIKKSTAYTKNAARTLIKHRREELVDYLNLVPQSREVYRRFRRTHISPITIRTTINDLIRDPSPYTLRIRNRLLAENSLKGGVY